MQDRYEQAEEQDRILRGLAEVIRATLPRIDEESIRVILYRLERYGNIDELLESICTIYDEEVIKD